MLRCQKEFSNYVDKMEHLLSSNSLFEKKSPSPLKQQILDTELVIPVIGAFSAGKSTLINELLGTQALPMGIAPETELATELRYSEESYLLAIKDDGSAERFSVEDLSEINRRSSDFLFLRLYLNNPALKAIAPLVLVDMPGFGSSLKNHNKAIAFYMPRGVHFIVVTSIEDGSVTQSMLRQLDEIRSYQTDFTFLLSKTNLRSTDQVKEVRQYIEDQLSLHFGDTPQVIPVGAGDGQPLNITLQALDPENMFSALFIDQLKNHNLDFIEQINLALHTHQQSAEQRKESLASLELALHALQVQREETVSAVRNKFSRNAQDKCLKNVDRALQNALDEFVTLAMRKNENALSNAITEVVRGSLTETVRSELDSASNEFVHRIAERMSSINGNLRPLDGTNWGLELGEKVNSSLRNASKALEGWVAVLDKVSSDKGGGIYKSISTILAVTTTIANPIVEIIVIFLPEIIRLFTGGNERNMIREKLLNDIFPSIKAEVRQHLPQALDQELQGLLSAINQEFEAQITKQQQVITSCHEEHAATSEEIAKQQAALEELRTAIQNLAKQYLYAQEA